MIQNLFLVGVLLIANLFSYGQTESASKFSDVSIDKFGNIKWTVSYFQDNYGFEIIVEQLKDGKWIDKGGLGGLIVAVKEKSSSVVTEKSSSTMRVDKGSLQVKFHKGTSIYRLRMIYPNQFTSEEFQFISEVSNDDGSLWIMDNVIYLDNVEKYEILDKVGSKVLDGEAKTIDISSLSQGSYFFYTKKFTKPFMK